MNKKFIFVSLLATVSALTLSAQSNTFHVKVNKLGAPIQPTMYGIFFEDINYAADGGLYAELVKNRSFEFPSNHFQGWSVAGNVELRNDGPFERNPHYVRLSAAGHPHKHTVLENEGFFGIGLKAGEKYRFSVWARCVEAGKEASIRVEFIDRSTMGEQQASVKEYITVNSTEWKKYEVEMTAAVTDPKAVLRIFLRGDNAVDLEHISLFPKDTWRGRENGLRKDLAQALYDLHPGLFRFPGGCIVEGTDLETRYQWKNTVGPVENRPLNENRWQYTFDYRFFSDYYQSYGLGFYEYFLLSEDIGAEPLPVLSCGLACQFQNENEEAHCPVDHLDEYIQDALDLIEFANGSVDSKWGAVRASMGHPDSFNLKYIAIGNEQWDQTYVDHLEPFVAAIRKAYPDIKIVGTSGPNSEGEQFDFLWPEMKKVGADLVDEHFYRPESWFLSQGARYDSYDRKGPKVFAGEYACHADNKANSFLTALCEAAFMTGLERNADVVPLSTYAPLFAHVEAWQWRPDLIWFDNLRVMKTPNYYVQQLYSHHAGTRVVPFLRAGKPLTGELSLYATAALDERTNELILKVVNTGIQARQAQIQLHGLSDGTHTGTRIQFHSMDVEAVNTLEQPERVHPEESAFTYKGNQMAITIQPLSFTIYRIRL